MKKLNLIGQKFNMLTVIGLSEKQTKYKQKYWICLCDCGNVTILSSNLLRRKNQPIKSCGCLRCKKTENIIESDDKYAYILIKDKKVIIDKENIDKIKNIKWHISKNGYVTNGNIYLHRLLLNFPNNKIIDHINHNKLDNRVENLRICGYSENAYNKKMRRNTKHYGISKHKNGYMIYIDGNYIGHKKTLEDAIKLRNANLKNSKALKYNEYLKEELKNV